MFARNVITLIVPLTIILLAVPLILQKIPRNGFYGFRTVFTMSSDEVWYHANKIAGFSLLVAGILWLVLGRVLPGLIHDQRQSYRLIGWIGAGALVTGCAVSYWLTSRKYPR
jgi:hypothetical protein